MLNRDFLNVVLFLILGFALSTYNCAIANDANSFQVNGGYKVKTNPIAQWLDDSVGKQTSQKNNKNNNNVNTPSYKNGFGYGVDKSNNGSDYSQKNTIQKKSNGGWSS